jgi:glycosyltransferase involved in cell wall biosynthesis
VVPAYNEEVRLGDSLPRLVSWLEVHPDAEVILVDDGSADRTCSMAWSHLGSVPRTSVLRLPWHAGKGAAVKLGISVARGDVIVFMDADLATDLDDVHKLVHGLQDADVAIGSRNLASSVVSGRSLLRAALNRAFAAYTRRMTGIAVTDTQCGFKALRSPVAKLLAGLAHLDGFAFDVEILVLASRLGYRIVEVPVRWQDVRGGKINLIRDPAAMLVDVAKVRAQRYAVRATAPFNGALGEAAYVHPRWTPSLVSDQLRRGGNGAGKDLADRNEEASDSGGAGAVVTHGLTRLKSE